jgi:hypothetical protein
MAQVPTESELDRATDAEYAAVSVLAVVGLVFAAFGGVALALPVAGFLVVLPVAGLALSLIALIRIRRSKGTLTGHWIAVVGVALGGVMGLLSGGQQLLAWHQQADENHVLTTATFEVAEALAAGDYEKVLVRIPADQRRTGGATAELLRSRFAPLFAGAGRITDRRLLSLDPKTTDAGERVAIGRVRIGMEHRAVLVTLLWTSAASPGVAPGTWQMVGASGEEALETSKPPADP